MGAIQSGINQLLTTAGVMAHLSPGLRAAAEKQNKLDDLRSQAAGFSAAGKEAALSANKTIEEAKNELDPEKKLKLRETAHRDLAESMDFVKRKEAIAKEMFETDPSEESYAKYKKIREGIETELTPQFKKMQESLDRMREKGQAKVEQRAKRRDFMKALGAEQVNFGSGTEGTVNELPKNLQKAIAAQYDKSQRKELMDKYYGK
jgi:hypothetical protein